MSEPALTQIEQDERLLTAYVARAGVELGAYWRDEIRERAEAGEFQPDDYYWHEGMDKWIRLGDLLGPASWIAPTPPRPPTTVKQKLIIGGAVAGGFALVLFIAIFFITRRDGALPVRGTRVATDAADPAKDHEQRDKAAGELRAKIERLPDRAAPPLNVFYYDVSVNMRRAVAARTSWQALIRGSENAVDPATEQTIRRTEFTLQTDYRAGEWVFIHYKASTRNLAEPGESEDEHDANTVAPPLVVTLLGLKIEPPDPERH
ncbi:MAG: DUF4339 domain-containing protein [Verrucomicrobiota bacterium]|nr:DUF4339 domain-containing protein [Verrucomicrobiota bacterium]